MRKLLVFIALLLFLALMGYVAYNFSQSERFGDETAHFIGGHFILQGKRIYQDLQFNHQPLPYFFSTISEFIANPKNLYLFIARQRETVFVYAAVWNVLYYFAFGPIFFLFTVLFEIIKYFFQGYKVLNETIAVYPLVYMFGVVVDTFLFKKKTSRLSLILFSVASFVVTFSLLPLWIVVVLFYGMLLYSLRKNPRSWKYALLPFFVLTVILSYFVSFPHLLKETVINNFVYFLPNSGGKISFLRMILLPFASFFPPYPPQKILIAVLMVFSILSCVSAFKKRLLSKYALVLLTIALTNFFRVDDYSFSNFHLLPWLGALMAVEMFWIKTAKLKIILVSILVVFLFVANGPRLFSKKNLATEYFINYSESESYWNAIRIMKHPRDRMLALPNDTLVYWVAEMDIPTHVLEYYPWIYHIPEYRDELITLFKKNPPEFVINTGLDPIHKEEEYILSILETQYQNLYHTGSPSRLYVLKKRLNTISDEQWLKLKEMLYSKSL